MSDIFPRLWLVKIHPFTWTITPHLFP